MKAKTAMGKAFKPEEYWEMRHIWDLWQYHHDHAFISKLSVNAVRAVPVYIPRLALLRPNVSFLCRNAISQQGMTVQHDVHGCGVVRDILADTMRVVEYQSNQVDYISSTEFVSNRKAKPGVRIDITTI